VTGWGAGRSRLADEGFLATVFLTDFLTVIFLDFFAAIIFFFFMVPSSG